MVLAHSQSLHTPELTDLGLLMGLQGPHSVTFIVWKPSALYM